MRKIRIDHLIDHLCQNFTAFLPKTLPSFCQVQEKLETFWNSNVTNSRRSSCRDHINGTFKS